MQRTVLSRIQWLALSLCAAALPVLMAGGCTAAQPSDQNEADGPEPTGDLENGVTFKTAGDAAAGSCTTSSVKGLSAQIIAEGQCIVADAYAEVPAMNNLILGTNINPYLEKPARDALVAAAKANPGKTMHVNSMLRTIAQQYLLYRWYQSGRCGIGLAAKPGNSNHETGLALDLDEYSSWKSALETRGFKWFGSADTVHFDYKGAGSASYKGIDIEAFQRLWNRNNPSDQIDADGEWGPQTEARMKKAPAAGFALGPSCADPDPNNPDPNNPDPNNPDPQACTDYKDASFTCSADGNSRGQCVSGSQKVETCQNGCLRDSASDDVCMGTTTSWSCGGTWGTEKAQNGDYYITAFGCWKDSNGTVHQDAGDNCIPACLSQAKSSGLCAGMTGPQCEESVNWYAADGGRFGCLARLRVTNPANGKSVVVVALDYGPNCSVEKQVSHAAVDMSAPANRYLFGSDQGIVDKSKVHVVEVDASTPLGPVVK